MHKSLNSLRMVVAAAFLVLLSAVIFVHDSKPTFAGDKSKKITIVYSVDMLGMIDPCG